ncbi:hypothetical protein E0Z10_g5728 [Xylaria hypoxylon]|uniref:Uncharacterized protein n=1 Tax=Xylaria hypoxylon TaxID=37992 RepID=A0A4Z0YV63_9PEZI|nr:hypothetical protein E0Z10_g5728 [Xylaria hypoxylon]
MGIASPNLALQNAFKPTITQEAQGSQPGHARITHFDFTRYTPSTPGSESHPIKIEDSPDTSLSWLTRPRKMLVHQEPLALPVTRLAIQHDYQASDANYIEKENPDGSSLTILPTGLEMSVRGISIIASPKAATSFLHCFLAAEKHWLKSRDHDIDPDIKFWRIFVARFNANPFGYQIDTWLTARKIATTLCGQPYKIQVRQQTTSADDSTSRLISAIEDCRRMSIRRRWGQQSGLENIETSSDDITTEEDAQKCILGRKPKTIEDQEKLIQALQKRCAESGHSNNPGAETSTTGLRANYQSAQKGKYQAQRKFPSRSKGDGTKSQQDIQDEGQ